MDSDLYIFLYIFSLFIHICCGAEYAYTIEVDAGKHNCFFQTVNNTHHKFMEIDYQVVDGGDLNINFMMLFGTKILLQEMMKVEGSHKFSMEESGDYQLCFDNSFSYQTRKVLFFELFLLDENGSFDETNTVEEFGPVRHEYSGLGFEMQKFQKASNNIKNLLNKIEYHQSLLRAYEARDRAIMNANFDRVTLWSVVNSIILVIVGLLQVYMIRSLFEDNSKLGQLLRRQHF
uniref:GOLD domain-containing protein n=1 Tax=Wuchereria bancrofti TaxID=6293 RepID=A0AAF5PJ59_WUCBA